MLGTQGRAARQAAPRTSSRAEAAEAVNAPTRLSLAALRADALFRLLLSPRGQIATLDDIARLPDLRGWNREAVEAAVAELVTDGRLVDDEHGCPSVVRS